MNAKRDVSFVSKTILMNGFDLIGENLLSIINKSMDMGVFPSIWKESIVVPSEKVKNTKTFRISTS